MKLSKSERVLAIIKEHADAELSMRDAARRNGDRKDALIHAYAAEALLAARHAARAALAAMKEEP